MSNDPATRVLIQDAERQADTLERADNAGTCPRHPDLAKGVSLSLRMLVGLYQAQCSAERKRSLVHPLAGLGIGGGTMTPICILFWSIGKSKGWW